MECVTLQTPHTLYRTSMLSVRQPNISHPEDILNRSEVYDSSVDCTVERSTVMRSKIQQNNEAPREQQSTMNNIQFHFDIQKSGFMCRL